MIKICNIPLEALLDYHEGRAVTRVCQNVRRHLIMGCSACRENLDWIRDYLPALTRSLQTEGQSVTAAALNRAYNLIRTDLDMVNALRPSRGSIFTTIAEVLFDSRARTGTFASARDLKDGSVHMVYRTDAADIDLWQERTPKGGWFITGQALGRSGLDLDPPSAASLFSPASGPSEANLEDSEFSFETVEPGNYSLRLTWEDREIRVDDLVVGSSEAP